MKGWDIPNITECLMKEPKGIISGLDDFADKFPLASLSSDKKHFIIIRDFSFHIKDGKINMTNSPGNDEKAHKGMTLVKAYDDGGNFWNAVLPDTLDYKRVEIDGEIINIYHGAEKTRTNFQEIHKLWSFYKFSENEILTIFQSFTNEFIEKPKIKKQTVKTIKTDTFGVLILDEKLDSYCSIISYDELELWISFSNIEKKQFDENLLKTKIALSRKENIQEDMINEMLNLKNKSWLENGQKELDKNDFMKDIQLYGLSIDEEGGIELYYKASDLFWGHEIMTRVDSDGNYKDSTIVG